MREYIPDLKRNISIRTAKIDQARATLHSLSDDTDCQEDADFCVENFPHLLDSFDAFLDSFQQVDALNSILLDLVEELPDESLATLREWFENVFEDSE